MADTIIFDEGVAYLGPSGLPSTCYFGLSTLATGSMTTAMTLAGTAWGEITGTGYARLSQARPTATGHQYVFTLMDWETGTATDWPNAVRAVALMTTSNNSGKLIAAANLIVGGGARDLSHAGVGEQVTPLLDFSSPS